MDNIGLGVAHFEMAGDEESRESSLSFDMLMSLLNSIIESGKGLKSICVTDLDGVVVLKASRASLGNKFAFTNPSIPIVFGNLVSSCDKLDEFGKASFLIIRTDTESTFQVNFHPLVIHILTSFEYEGRLFFSG
ncbi:ragulator complex protein [Cryptosporidium felis]|nr:ragulator complex protein [Cryptosporidium felis]